jgi:hypothetical protein
VISVAYNAAIGCRPAAGDPDGGRRTHAREQTLDDGGGRPGRRAGRRGVQEQARLMLGRKASFWLAVGGVSILANFTLELARARFPQTGLSRFVDFIHRGPGGGA